MAATRLRSWVTKLRHFAYSPASAVQTGRPFAFPCRSLSTAPILPFNRPTAATFLPSNPAHGIPIRVRELGLCRTPAPLSLMFVRWRTKVRRARAPDTPVKSKLKKYKIKGYSSYKSRFKPLNDGTIRRWKEGNRHNAHSKSKTAKRRMRQPALVPLAYAKTMKKLHFFA